MNLVKTIRSAVDSDNVILGTRQSLEAVLSEKVKLIVVASNCEPDAKDDLKRYSKLSGIEVQEFEGSSVELGEVCGKPFVVSMLGVLGGSKPEGKKKRKK